MPWPAMRRAKRRISTGDKPNPQSDLSDRLAERAGRSTGRAGRRDLNKTAGLLHRASSLDPHQLAARGIPADLLRTKLAALRGVLVEQLSPELSPLATDCLDRALAEFEGEPVGLTPLTVATPGGELAAKYLVAVLEGDRRKASRLILKVAEEGRTAADLCLNVLQPAQEELGRCRVLGEINVAEEHFATATTRLIAAPASCSRRM